MHQEPVAPVGEIEPAMIRQAAPRRAGHLEDRREKLLAVGRALEGGAEPPRGGREVGEGEPVQRIEIDRLAGPGGQVGGQGVERTQVGKTRGIGQIAKHRREVGRRRLRRIRVARLGPSQPVLAPLPLVPLSLLEEERIVSTALMRITAALVAAPGEIGAFRPTPLPARGGSLRRGRLRRGLGSGGRRNPFI